MSNIEWFKNEVELVKEFLHRTSGLIAMVEAYDAKLILLIEGKCRLESETSPSMVQQIQLNIIDETMNEIEVELKEKLKALQGLKERYMAEELLDTIETLTSIEEGEQLSDMACEVIKIMNLLMRKYNVSYIG